MTGVLTKPDKLQEGEKEKWLQIMTGEKHALRHGYYMTRLSGAKPKEMNQTWEEAREVENNFFRTAPWNRFKDRLGIIKLTSVLSNELAKMIQKRFLCNQCGSHFVDYRPCEEIY